MNVSIRNVNEDTWAEFKARAAANDLNMAEYLEKLLEEARKMESNWIDVLYGEKTMDEETAKDIMNRSKELRKNFKMRDLDWN